jgi:hypothetical protein
MTFKSNFFNTEQGRTQSFHGGRRLFLPQRHKESQKFAEDLLYQRDGWIIFFKENIIRLFDDRTTQKWLNHE